MTADELGIDSYRAGLLPQDKVSGLEEVMATFGVTTAYYRDCHGITWDHLDQMQLLRRRMLF